jgi:hypothetical protein
MSQISQRSRARPAINEIDTLIGPAVLVIFALAALPLLWRALERLGALLVYPYPDDGLEGTLLYEARLLWAGEPMYQPFEPHRFVSAPYPPLHPLLLGLADRIAGPHIFWGGRLLSLAAGLAVAMLIVLIVRRVAGSWIAGLLGAVLFLSAPPTLLWATRIKPDMLALFWTALGLYLATTANRRSTEDRRSRIRDGRSSLFDPRSSILDPRSSILNGQRWVVGAAVCFALAFFTKQTALAAPLATGGALLISDWRAFRGGARDGFVGRAPLRWRTLAFGLTYLILVAGVWLLLDAITNGQFTFHIWVMHQRASWLPYLLAKFAALLVPYWPLMLLGAALLIHTVRDERALPLGLYLLLVPLSLLGAGKTGANHNHLLETLLALTVAGGIVVGWAARAWPSWRTGRWSMIAGRSSFVVAAALFAIQLGLAFRPQEWYTGELAPTDPPERYLIFIRNTPGEILADDVGLLFMAGRPLRYDDPSGLGPVALSRLWDQRGLVEEITQRRFSAILIPINVKRSASDPAGHWTPEMLAAIRAHYRMAFHDTIDTYVPK